MSRSGLGVSGEVVGCSGFMPGPAAGHGLGQRYHNLGMAGGETVWLQQEPTAALSRRDVLLGDLGGMRAWLCLKPDLMPAEPKHQVEDRGRTLCGSPAWMTSSPRL
jgi:hypothetical protein